MPLSHHIRQELSYSISLTTTTIHHHLYILVPKRLISRPALPAHIVHPNSTLLAPIPFRMVRIRLLKAPRLWVRHSLIVRAIVTLNPIAATRAAAA